MSAEGAGVGCLLLIETKLILPEVLHKIKDLLFLLIRFQLLLSYLFCSGSV